MIQIISSKDVDHIILSTYIHIVDVIYIEIYQHTNLSYYNTYHKINIYIYSYIYYYIYYYIYTHVDDHHCFKQADVPKM